MCRQCLIHQMQGLHRKNYSCQSLGSESQAVEQSAEFQRKQSAQHSGQKLSRRPDAQCGIDLLIGASAPNLSIHRQDICAMEQSLAQGSRTNKGFASRQSDQVLASLRHSADLCHE